MKFLEELREHSKNMGKTIVFPEGHDRRIVEAAGTVHREGIAKVIILGSGERTGELAGLEIINPERSEYLQDFIEAYFIKRQKKGITREMAGYVMVNPTYFGAMMVEKGFADGCISGADTTTGDVLRAAIHIIGTNPDAPTVSSDIIMITPDEKRIWSFADCAVLPDPTSEQLADIAISTAETHRKIVKVEPKVAMLSFSTKGSAKHALTDKVVKATELVKQRRPELQVDGELQLDAAIVPAVGEKKSPNSSVAGKANVLIFPDLNAGNIGYKLVQRIAGCEAIGPIIQGLRKPTNDLSRGCSVDDIINVAAILCNLA